MARLFFAIWPSEAARASLAKLAIDLALVADGRPVPAAKIHLTLAFLGEVSAEESRAALIAAEGVRRASYRVRLDRVGSFRAARVAWAGCARCDASLAALQKGLAQKLRGAGFALEERPFTPHLTLARRTRRAVPAASIAPIAWEADAFALVRTLPGTGEYENVQVFGKG